MEEQLAPWPSPWVLSCCGGLQFVYIPLFGYAQIEATALHWASFALGGLLVALAAGCVWGWGRGLHPWRCLHGGKFSRHASVLPPLRPTRQCVVRVVAGLAVLLCVKRALEAGASSLAAYSRRKSGDVLSNEQVSDIWGPGEYLL